MTYDEEEIQQTIGLHLRIHFHKFLDALDHYLNKFLDASDLTFYLHFT